MLALARHKTIRQIEELVARLAGYKLTLTISESTRGKLKQLQDLLAHKIPKGDLGVILDRALDALLTEVHKQKTGITAKQRATRAPEVPQPTPGAQTRHLTASDRREVWARDEGRCGFIGEDGHCCNETRGLQFAHREPWAKGGANTAENLGLRCPAHNALEADRDYGTRFMANKRKQKPLKVREPTVRYVLGREPRATLADVDRSEHLSSDASSLERALSASDGSRRRGTDGLGDLIPETGGHEANAVASPLPTLRLAPCLRGSTIGKTAA